MTRVVLIHAGPTQWDIDGRLVGDHPLPLTELARATIQGIVNSLPHPVTAVYRAKRNEAADQAARIVASRFSLRPIDNPALDEMNLGLWEGLTTAELKSRHPKVFGQWQENPQSVHPPQGETLQDATERLRAAVRKILQRKRGVTVVLAVRPLAMRILLGILRREDDLFLARHLHQTTAVETIEIANDQLHLYIS